MTAMSSRSYDRFANTRWSVVMQVAKGDSPDAQTALAELAQRYWYPVYAYVRRCGHPAVIAEEISRTFMRQLIALFQAAGAKPPHGQFRRFLLDELNAFLGADWRASISDAGGAGPEPPSDLETRYQRDNVGATSPEAAYQRGFALEVLGRALRRLRAEAEQTGHGAMFEELHPFLTHDPVPGEYQIIASRLTMPALALVVALKRLRQRLRELAGQELSDTVTSAEQLASEQGVLLTILRETPRA